MTPWFQIIVLKNIYKIGKNSLRAFTLFFLSYHLYFTKSKVTLCFKRPKIIFQWLNDIEILLLISVTHELQIENFFLFSFVIGDIFFPNVSIAQLVHLLNQMSTFPAFMNEDESLFVLQQIWMKRKYEMENSWVCPSLYG